MTQKNAPQPGELTLTHLPKPSYEDDEILGELYAVKLQLNREANYDVAVLLREARADANQARH